MHQIPAHQRFSDASKSPTITGRIICMDLGGLFFKHCSKRLRLTVDSRRAGPLSVYLPPPGIVGIPALEIRRERSQLAAMATAGACTSVSTCRVIGLRRRLTAWESNKPGEATSYWDG